MRTPQECAQLQLDAYNARDIEAFALIYAEDVVCYDLDTGDAFCNGRAELVERYGAMFSASPNLHCKLVNRIVCGRWVFDEEVVTGQRNSLPIHATAVYDVTDGVIRRAWFVRDSA